MAQNQTAQTQSSGYRFLKNRLDSIINRITIVEGKPLGSTSISNYQITTTGGNLTSISGYNSFGAFKTAVGAAQVTALMDTDTTISTAEIVPASVRFLPTGTGRFVKSGAGTLEFQGAGVLPAARVDLFSSFAAGDVKFTGAYPDAWYPEWFGAKGDGVTDDLPAFKKMFAAMAKEFDFYVGGKVQLRFGAVYFCAQTLLIPRNVEIVGGTGDLPPAAASYFKFPANTKGIQILDNRTHDAWYGTTGGKNYSGGGKLRGFGILGAVGGNNAVVNTSGLTITLQPGGAITRVGAGIDDSLNPAEQALVPGSTVTVNGFNYVVHNDLSNYAAVAAIPVHAPHMMVDKHGTKANTLVYLVDYTGFPTNNDWAGQQCSIFVDGLGEDVYTIVSHTATEITLDRDPPPGRFRLRVFGIKAQSNVAARVNLYHGIDCSGQFKFEEVQSVGFAGNAIVMHSSRDPYSNVNNSTLTRCSGWRSQGSGLVFRGIDANNINTKQYFGDYNEGYGFYESGSFGSNHDNWHLSFNKQGSFNITSAVSRTMITSGYTEPGMPPGRKNGQTFLIGGNNNAGIDPTYSVAADLFLENGVVQNQSGIRHSRGVEARDGQVNDKAFALQIGHRFGGVMAAISIGEDALNTAAGNPAHEAKEFSYWLSYDKMARGWLSLGHGDITNALSIGNSILAFSSDKAAVGRGQLRFSNSFIIDNYGARPAAADIWRGKLWFAKGAAGVADKIQICVKNAADAYVWVDFTTA